MVITQNTRSHQNDREGLDVKSPKGAKATNLKLEAPPAPTCLHGSSARTALSLPFGSRGSESWGYLALLAVFRDLGRLFYFNRFRV